MQLTDLQCKKFKSQNKPYKKADGRGLFMLIKPNGTKLWRYKYRIEKKEKLYSIGAYPEYSLAEAREIHQSLHKMVAEGTDPLEYKKEQERKEQIENILTFSLMAHEWLGKYKQEVKPQTFVEVEKRVKKYILPAIGHISMKDLTPQHFLMMIKEIEGRGTIELAKRIRQYCSQVLRYALACGKVTRDFTLDIRGALIKPKTKHHPALITPEEVKEFLEAFQHNDAGLNRQTRHGLEMLMLTFVRPIEMAGARWKEFDFDQKIWVIPAERMKMEYKHVVPLSKQVLRILEQLKKTNEGSEYVLPNRRDFNRHISRDAFSKAVRLLGFQDRHCAHGFRAMAETLIQEQLEYDFSVVDRQLAHKPKGSLGATYNRAQFLEKRTVMMQDWADYIDRLKF